MTSKKYIGEWEKFNSQYIDIPHRQGHMKKI